MKTSKRKPVCLIAGGPGTDHGILISLFRKVFKVTGVDSPRVAYIGAASGDNLDFFSWLRDMLRKAGASEVVLVPLARKNRVARGVAVLKVSDIVFMSGGDVEKGMKLLEKRRLVPVLRRLFAKGVPFFGLSAGSIMLAKSWVKWRDPDDDSTAGLFRCLGFAPVLCDTHGEDGDWEELRVLLGLVRKGTVGYGITSTAGLIVMSGGRVRTMGGAVHRVRLG